ncbi:alpha,alpha-trehalase [Candidatus Curtissbacteria bacterium]|nr:alpha,alpha-trehalase [Candidatus Curtissbacteria bacterium]
MDTNSKNNTLQKAQEYILTYWENLERYNPHDEETLVGLPWPYLVPSSKNGTHFTFNEMYYWDSYFISLGLFGTKWEQFPFYIVENFVNLIERFGMVPNASRFYFTSRSQPPFLTSLIFSIYEKGDFKNPKIEKIVAKYNNKEQWLSERIEVAKKEYSNVWMNEQHPHWRRVFNDLSRYYDINALHGLAEAESGWDMTPRFERQALDYIPADLNSLLYKYEADFARAAEILKDEEEAKVWRKHMEKRKETMTKYMWSEEDGFFFDYNYVAGERAKTWSLAAYYTMWAGLATEEQAKKLVANLDKFENDGGLATCLESKHEGPRFTIAPPMQWDYPNGWAPLQLIVIQGLENYGYHKEAQRIAEKWIENNLKNFENHGVFFEKYNAVDPAKDARDGVYPQQKGFGWTNAVFSLLLEKYPQK